MRLPWAGERCLKFDSEKSQPNFHHESADGASDFSAAEQAEQEQHHEYHHENAKQEFSNRSGRAGDSPETEQPGDDGNHQKY